jgi:hypothetical protein
MVSILRIGHLLEAVGGSLEEVLSARRIEEVCRGVGHRWRRRELGPVQTVYLFILQALHGNTALEHLRRLAGLAVGASAVCRAKARLPLAALRALTALAAETVAGDAGGGGGGTGRGSRTGVGWSWHGLRVRAADATGCGTPDTASLREAFGKSSGRNHKHRKRPQHKAKAKGGTRAEVKSKRTAAAPRRKARRVRARRVRARRVRARHVDAAGFPVVKVLALFDLGAGALLKAIPLPLHRQELSVAARLPRGGALGPGDVLVADRAFACFAFVAVLLAAGVEACIHLPARQRLAPRVRSCGTRHKLRRLGREDWLVRWDKAHKRAGWLSRPRWATLPATLTLRQVAYRVTCKGCRTRRVTVITTLLDPVKYPAADLAELYLRRWKVEGCFRCLKQEMKMDTLHARTARGVKKELLAFALAYNLVRTAMVRAALAQQADPWHLSFVDALRWAWAPPPVARGGADASQPDTSQPPVLLVNPERPDRFEPRMVKRRPKGYCRLTRPRAQLRQQMTQKKVAA